MKIGKRSQNASSFLSVSRNRNNVYFYLDSAVLILRKVSWIDLTICEAVMSFLIKRSLLKFAVISSFLATSSALALNTTVTLQADVDVTPGANEVVTFGLPLAESEVLNLSEIKVLNGSTELPIAVEGGLRWHWSDNSYRSVTIQLQNVNMTSGNIILTVTDEGRNVANDVTAVPHTNGWVAAGANKDSQMYPRIFALHDPFYLDDTGVIPPYNAAPSTPDSFEQFQVAQYNNWSGGLNFNDSSRANWLFDRSSAYFKIYMTTGRVEFLKEAFLSKRFYFEHIRNDGTAPAPVGGDGCWLYGGTITRTCPDGKYIAPQQAKLAWALVGDNSQWDSDLIVEMALQADLGWNQYGSRGTFSSENQGFTERGAGIAGLAEIIAYEMTGNTTVLSHLNERIAFLKDMQQTVKSWDTEHGWTPKSGGFTHNLDRHDGNCGDDCPVGDTDSRGFSAWMSENIVDFLWHTYWVTEHEDVPEMLKQIAHAVNDYGFTSVYNATSGEHDTLPEFAGSSHTQGCNTTGADTDLLYMASAHASNTARIQDDWWAWYSDSHNVETVLILTSGYYFETDNAQRLKLRSRIEKLIEGWSHTGCAGVFSNVYRLFNWQHRSNSVRTWSWVDEAQQPPVSTSSSSSSSSTTSSSTSSSSGGAQPSPPSAPGIVGVAVSVPNASSNSASSSSASSSASSSSGVTSSSSSSSSNSSASSSSSSNNSSSSSSTTSSSTTSTSSSSSGGTAPPPPPLVDPGEIAFQNVTEAVTNAATEVEFHFWAGLPDVNADGCLDIYIGAHSDAIDSAMHIQNKSDGRCTGTFTHLPDNNNYSQATPEVPRITSRYIWGNWYNHPHGMWSFFGHDVDGNPGARYRVSDSVTPGQNPTYFAKSIGCHLEVGNCLPIEMNGDGDLEMVVSNYHFDRGTTRARITDLDSGSIDHEGSASDAPNGVSYVIADVTGNGYPEIVNPHDLGWWQFNTTVQKYQWQASKFSASVINAEGRHPANNHMIPFDYDADGDTDLLFGRGLYNQDGTLIWALYRNNGDSTFTDVTNASGWASVATYNEDYWTTYANSVAADLNLDGYPDILIGGEKYANNVTIVWNNGNGTFTADRTNQFGTCYSDSNYAGKAWIGAADYDNDGRIDIIKTHGYSGNYRSSVGLFRNVSNINNHWLRIRARGIGGNTDGLHTRLIIREPNSQNVITSYEVGIATVGSQNLLIHAGLGTHATVDVLAKFPHGGGEYLFEDVAADQDIIVFANGDIVTGYQPGTAVPMTAN